MKKIIKIILLTLTVVLLISTSLVGCKNQLKG